MPRSKDYITSTFTKARIEKRERGILKSSIYNDKSNVCMIDVFFTYETNSV